MTAKDNALAILNEYISALRDLERANKIREACHDRKDAAFSALQGLARREGADDANSTR